MTMKRNTTLHIVAACGIVALAPAAHADDAYPPSAQTQDEEDIDKLTPPETTELGTPDTKPPLESASKPITKGESTHQLGVSEIMRITQTAMTHVAAAERALERGDTDAAESALEKSERALSRLYQASEQQGLLGELDQAIQQTRESTAPATDIDLAPLMAKVTRFQAFVDPEVRAHVKDAQRRADEGDAQGAEEALRLARNRVAVEMAFVPIEAAYTRVLAAQRVLDQGKPEEAAKFLEDVPIVVSQVRISQPLVPIRFKLHAAAEAAEAGNVERSQQLLSQVDKDMQELVRLASDDEQLRSKLSQIGEDIEQLTQRAREGAEPNAQEIRAIAKRTRDLGTGVPEVEGDEQQTMAPPEDMDQPG